MPRDSGTGRFTTPAGAMGLDARKYYYDDRGWERLKGKLKAHSLKGAKLLRLHVGYRAHYAIYVHEDLQTFHAIGNAKYLEGPARRGRGYMAKIVKMVLQRKKSLESALDAASEWLRVASQEEVPVDTGFLRESWFTRLVR